MVLKNMFLIININISSQTLQTLLAITTSRVLYVGFPEGVSPAGGVHGLLVWRRDGETYRGDHGFIPCGTDHFPLGPLGVVFQHTLLSSVYCDLRGGRGTELMQEQEEGGR